MPANLANRVSQFSVVGRQDIGGFARHDGAWRQEHGLLRCRCSGDHSVQECSGFVADVISIHVDAA